MRRKGCCDISQLGDAGKTQMMCPEMLYTIIRSTNVFKQSFPAWKKIMKVRSVSVISSSPCLFLFLLRGYIGGKSFGVLVHMYRVLVQMYLYGPKQYLRNYWSYLAEIWFVLSPTENANPDAKFTT